VGRGATAALGLTILAIAAIFLAKGMLQPTQEEVERTKDVLNKDALPRLNECRELGLDELPEGLEPPGVGATHFYLSIVVFFPGYATVEGAEDYRLTEMDGRSVALSPMHTEVATEEDGAYVSLIFRLDDPFSSARLMHGEEEILAKVVME